MVYTARFARGHDGSPAQPNGFEQLIADMGITQKNGAANHPTTQGKIERFHQTLKRWLAAHEPAASLEELTERLQTFGLVYNTERPHRAIGRRTPAQAYTGLPKATPTVEVIDTLWRVRYDRVDSNGKLSLRYAGRLRHLGIGRAHADLRVLMLIHSNETLIVERDTGPVIAEHTIDPNRDYQPKKK